MADPPSYSTPRWVKIFGIVALLLVLLVAIILLSGLGGDHGPGRHLPSGAVSDTPPAGATENRAPSAVATRATERR